MNGIDLLAQAVVSAAPDGPNVLLRALVSLFLILNAVSFFLTIEGGPPGRAIPRAMHVLSKLASRFLIYEALVLGAIVMLLPFYWMIVTSFKDARTAAAFPPVWTPSRVESLATPPGEAKPVEIIELETQKQAGQPVKVVPASHYQFKRIDQGGVMITKEVADPAAVFQIDPKQITTQTIFSLDTKNFRRAWHRPEDTSRGQVNFLTYFFVSISTSLAATIGTLLTSALAAFAFARFNFFAKDFLFYLILATMMVPGQVLLIPNFLMLSSLGLLDTYAALIVPWLASVFTIFLMRQFFLTIPEDLWDAARIDGSSRFRYLWQIVVPLSKPVFITAGIFDFLNNWNSLLWPLIVTSTPTKRTLMVGLQNLNEEAGAEFHILMAASCFAIIPVVIFFFILQRFFIEGIARTGLK